MTVRHGLQIFHSGAGYSAPIPSIVRANWKTRQFRRSKRRTGNLPRLRALVLGNPRILKRSLYADSVAAIWGTHSRLPESTYGVPRMILWRGWLLARSQRTVIGPGRLLLVGKVAQGRATWVRHKSLAHGRGEPDSGRRLPRIFLQQKPRRGDCSLVLHLRIEGMQSERTRSARQRRPSPATRRSPSNVLGLPTAVVLAVVLIAGSRSERLSCAATRRRSSRNRATTVVNTSVRKDRGAAGKMRRIFGRPTGGPLARGR